MGVALFGAKTAIGGLGIFSMVPGAAFQTGRHGGGLSIAGCSDVDAKGLRVVDGKSYGGAGRRVEGDDRRNGA